MLDNLHQSVASVANRKTVIEGLERAELVIVQETFVDMETSAYADVVLPASLWSESTGIFINSERNLTLFEPALTAPGQAIPDWLIIARIACEMGYADAFTYADAEEIFEEIKTLPQSENRLRPARSHLRQASGQPHAMAVPAAVAGAARPHRRWRPQPDPLPQRRGEANPVHRTRRQCPEARIRHPNRRAQFFARPHMDPFEMPDDDYPILLNTAASPTSGTR